MRPRFIPAYGQPPDPSLWTLGVLAAWAVAMAGIALSPELRRRLSLEPLPLRLRARAHFTHSKQQVRALFR